MIVNLLKVTRFVLISALCFVSQNFYCQYQTAKWCFGQNAGLDFMTSPPTPLTGVSLNTQEGCSSIADAQGNLLFYTDGITVWNSTNAVMANGFGLLGNSSSTQSGVIVKQPGNSNIYYVFTLGTGGGNSVYYSIVDMNLAAGSGSVITKNVFLNGGSTEKLTSVKSCNGSDVWIITHDLNSNNFRCYLVSSAGVNPTAVVTPIGTVHTGYIGYLKASPQGTKLGLGIYGNDQFELYDFDVLTGVVSNSLVLANVSSPYGCEFSPDGTKFYGTREGAVNILYQWDLCAGSNNAIIASQFTMATTPGVQIFELQAALDGKIYMARYQQQTLGVINNPNVYGSGCNFVDLGQSIAPGTCRIGLPNFITSLFAPSFTLAPINFTLTPGIACGAISCLTPTLPAVGPGGCSGSPVTPPTYLWNFGDPSSGAANTSTLSNPTHTYNTTGTYSLSLTVSKNCGSYSISQEISVFTGTQVAISGSFSICPGMTTTLTGNGAVSYTWNTGATTSSIGVSPIVTTVYTVTGSDANGCKQVRTTTVNVSPFGNNPALNVGGNFTICSGQATTLTASGASSYTWSTNANSVAIVVNPTVTTSYTVNAKALNACQDKRVVVVNVFKCTGITPVSNSKPVHIYPNPTSGRFEIETTESLYFFLYDKTGALVLQRTVDPGTAQLDITLLSSGIYFLRVMNRAGEVTDLRLIKE